jgi:oxygen-independent coproporphyrinogen-3 oxidase
MKPPFSLYIHIPFCVSKCPYCDFNSHVVPEIPETHYTNALLRELEYYSSSAQWQGRKIQSVFFGGGTPSTFKPASIASILARTMALFPVNADCEITLEANPGTVEAGNFSGYREGGVNRISVGVQSFQPRLVKFLGRIHSVGEAKKALHIVRQAGFDNFSLDLIFANPGQTLAELDADLDAALEFNPPHMSLYNLTFEEGTPFHHEYRAGRMHSLSEEEEIAMAELIESKLGRAGLCRYEISNYAKSGRHSSHNVNYWQAGDYLGLGAGAHSYLRTSDRASGQRWSNEKNPGKYMTQVNDSSRAVVDREEIDPAKAAGEFMFLGLRMTEGISEKEFAERFGKTPAQVYPQIGLWLEEHLLEELNGFLRFTAKGLLLANSLFVHFM